jgi:hypothetical protein
MVGAIKHEALSSNPSTVKKKKKNLAGRHIDPPRAHQECYRLSSGIDLS